MPPLTIEDILQIVAQSNMDVNKNGTVDPGGTASDRYDAFTDLARIAGGDQGITIEDLLGIAPAPEDPGAAPVYDGFQPELPGVYTSPVMQGLLENAYNGGDPIVLAKELQLAAEADPTLLEQLPTRTEYDNFGNRTEVVDVNGIASIAADYKSQIAKAARDDAGYQQEFNTWQQAKDAFDSYNTPTTAYDQMGAPSVDQLVNDLVTARGADTNFGRKLVETGYGDLYPGRRETGTPEQALANMQRGPDKIRSMISPDYLTPGEKKAQGLDKSWDTWSKPVIRPQGEGVSQSPGSYGITQGIRARGNPKTSEVVQGRRMAAVEDAIRKNVSGNVERAKKRVVEPSQRDKDNQARMQYALAYLYG